ncbi:LysR family transcriptional regulator [Selenomonas sp.]|uniref:LysR family transcriptional regulator n=1 Tax=Selenomonas sp. TaxID=2053611 RepID=UPI0025FA5306|nr:LysR family transcriptional regulator [Selenomonas sp.]MBQ1868817.1 LysR family transcriptional regulator [Selenomonas sp.]
MTLKQLRYAVTVAETGNITEAAKKLFIAQPSLTAAIHSLEEEYGITIFSRSNKGIEITPAGDELLGYARQILEQADLMHERYIGKSPIRQHFCVSSQHYSFVVEAFVGLIRQFDGDKYEFHMRETQTYEIIDDVAHMRSEVGILYRNKFNRSIITKTLKDNQLTFTPLFTASPHVFVGKNSPLAQKDRVTLDDLKPFPRLSYEQGSHNSFYFSEEILSTEDCDKELVVCDRATLFNMVIGLNGYTICSGSISEELNGSNIVARPLAVDDYMEIGYILPKSTRPSRLTLEFLDILTNLTAKLDTRRQ